MASFVEVLNNRGRKWQKASWNKCNFIYFNGEYWVFELGAIFKAIGDDLTATDWTEAVEPKKKKICISEAGMIAFTETNPPGFAWHEATPEELQSIREALGL